MTTRGNVPGRDDTFDAGQYGTLRYDFKKFGGIQGIIPDPSDEMIEEYMRGLRDMAKEYGADEDVNTEDLSADQLQEILDNDKNLQIAEAQKAMCEMTAKLCGGSPTFDQLIALPFRVRQGFTRWLQRKLMNPEADAAASTPSRVARLGG